VRDCAPSGISAACLCWSLAVVHHLHPESLAGMLTGWGVLAAEPGLRPVTHRHPGGYRT